jgi:hypothetical protein
VDTSYLINDPAMMDAVLTDILFWSILIIGIGCYVYDAIKTLVIVHRMEEREMGKMRGRRGHRI